jgi:4a-hydroxytetrahydrobiopterin dehydratase
MTESALIAESSDHHPEWFNAYKKVIVDLTTHEAGFITERDLDLAESMEKIAIKKGVSNKQR